MLKTYQYELLLRAKGSLWTFRKERQKIIRFVKISSGGKVRHFGGKTVENPVEKVEKPWGKAAECLLLSTLCTGFSTCGKLPRKVCLILRQV